MDGGAEAGGFCGLCCTGILQQFFNTRTWGSNWTCMDKCCRCDCCWDAGEYDPNDLPGGQRNTKKEEGNAPPPAYQKADPMTVSSKEETNPGSNAKTDTTANQNTTIPADSSSPAQPDAMRSL